MGPQIINYCPVYCAAIAVPTRSFIDDVVVLVTTYVTRTAILLPVVQIRCILLSIITQSNLAFLEKSALIYVDKEV